MRPVYNTASCSRRASCQTPITPLQHTARRQLQCKCANVGTVEGTSLSGQGGQRLKMTVAYDGSAFAGFQFQPGKVRTVQGELEGAATRLFIGRSRMVGASRTDGGAHALRQVVHFDVVGSRDSVEADCLYLNSFLPQDVRVLQLEVAPAGFDSHFNSLGKTYEYRLSAGIPEPTQARYRWWVYERWCERSRGKPQRLSDVSLDVTAMRAAAELLQGQHDFSAFMDKKRPAGLGSVKRKKPHLAEKGIKPQRTAEKNIRVLLECTVRESFSAVTGGQEVTLELTGNGFLYRQVRMLAAGLVEVGHGRMSPQQLAEVMESGDRSALPAAAPPHGLYLAHVHYPGDALWQERVERMPSAARESLGDELFMTQGQKAALGIRRARLARAQAANSSEGASSTSTEGDDGSLVDGADGLLSEVGGALQGDEELGEVGELDAEAIERLRKDFMDDQ